MKRLPWVLSTVTIAFATIVPASPQTAASTTGPPTPVSGFGFGPAGNAIAPVAHAPFSAVLVQQSEQTLSDGTTISREFRETVVRDSMGRIYRGRELRPPGARSSEPHLLFTITDPVEHVQFVCNSVPKHCRKMEYRSPPNKRRPVYPARQKDIVVEDLGTSNIDGVEAQGQRITRTIPEGQVGNDRPFTTTEERWHSNDLDIDVEVKRSDPRAGTRTNTLTDLKLGEPDEALFRVPENYKIDVGGLSAGALSPLQTESDNSYPAGTMPPPRQ